MIIPSRAGHPFTSSLVFCAAVLLLDGRTLAVESPWVVTPDHPTGVYAPNEKITWNIDIKGDRTGLSALPYKITKDALTEVEKGTLDLSSGPATISASRDTPGALLVEIFSADKTKVLPVAMGGAVISPAELGPATPPPTDFDAFWQAKLQELSKVPAHPVLEKVNTDTIKNSEGVDCYKVALDNIRGTHAIGVLARPAKEGKFPAMLMVNSAGVSDLDRASLIAQAKPGWLVLNVSAHDLPLDQPDAYYADLKAGSLKNYFSIGSESRETSYFLRMFLGCVRGAEYLSSRPDWDGKTLVVTGTSQGGLQSFATAALYPKITAVMVMVPAGCDNYGPLGNPPRALGWPYWLAKWALNGKDAAKVQQTAGYFDGLYFAARIRCPVLVAVALLDIAARPAGVIAAYNGIKAPKELIIMPISNHYGEGSGGAYNYRFLKWKDALQKGLPLPIAAPNLK